MLLLVLGCIGVVLICIRIHKPHKYWREKGVRYVRPWPFFGYMAASIFRFKAFPHILQSLYNAFPEQRYFGCYQFLTPSLVIRDPDLIKTIMVKEFETFPEHRTMIEPENDPLWSKSLISLKGGEQWRDMRSTLSPAFTSSKMRNMFILMRECAQEFTNHFLQQGGTISVELKDTTTKFANDIIASTAFGISCNSLKNPDNYFYLMAKQATDFSFSRMLKFFGYIVSPAAMKFFRVKFFGNNVTSFCENLVKETIRSRQEGGIVRPDMIHLLMEAQKGRLNHDDVFVPDSGFATVEESTIGKRDRKTAITNQDIAAQSLLFYFAGFETVSLALSHLAYELALNADIQEKLAAEVDETREECVGEITYEALLKMKYMDMVVSEVLRKWPPAMVTDRKSVKQFTIQPERVWEKVFQVDAGTECMIPVFAIHRDPKYYPEPNKFDPERFSDENKSKIKPFTYMPFGVGPRNCIGSRFALLELKTFIFYVLSEFEIVPTEKTQIPLVLSKKAFNLVSDQGFWVGLKPRHKKTA